MEIRDAVENDADAMAAIADAPTDVMRNLVHDRTVMVAVDEATSTDPNDDSGGEPQNLLGFVSFDARSDTVHVTQLDGTSEACEQLLSEPVRFAQQEGMSVELLVPEPASEVAAAADHVGFDRIGEGPQFAGEPTVRFRLEP